VSSFPYQGQPVSRVRALDLAADALELSGASRAQPVEFDGIRERQLPEIAIRAEPVNPNETLFAKNY
jgi:hypothetical protein